MSKIDFTSSSHPKNLETSSTTDLTNLNIGQGFVMQGPAA